MAIYGSITSLEDPLLAPYRTLRQQVDHRSRRIFVAEGDKVVRRLLESGLEVDSVVLPPQQVESFAPLLATRRPELPVYCVEKPLLEGLTGFQYYQGVLAVGRVPSPPPLEDLLRAMTRAPLLLAIDGLSNPENVGTIVRTAGALGVAGILAGPTTTSPYLRRAVRSSMGAVFGIPILEVETLEGSLASLAAHGIDCIAAHPHGAAHRLPELDLTRGCCLVLGSEGEGISPPVLAACHRTASIAMANGVDSLNVGAAAAAFLYEAARQRGRV